MTGNIARYCTLALLALSASPALADSLDVNIHIGDQPRQVIAPEPAAPMVVFDDDVDFIYPPTLGFYVAVGVPYDLFYVRKNYYLYRDGRWHRSLSGRGPWVVVAFRDLPPGLRRHKIERIRSYRNAEYDVYRRDRDHYRSRHFRSNRDQWQVERRDVNVQRREIRPDDRGQRQQRGREENVQRQEMKRDDSDRRNGLQREGREDRREMRRDDRDERRPQQRRGD